MDDLISIFQESSQSDIARFLINTEFGVSKKGFAQVYTGSKWWNWARVELQNAMLFPWQHRKTLKPLPLRQMECHRCCLFLANTYLIRWDPSPPLLREMLLEMEILDSSLITPSPPPRAGDMLQCPILILLSFTKLSDPEEGLKSQARPISMHLWKMRD